VGDLITRVNEIPDCPDCGKPMKRELHSQFAINMGPCKAYGYYDETLGKYIHTNRQRKEEMRKQGVREKESPKVWFR
jgi:hypothetical protein